MKFGVVVVNHRKLFRHRETVGEAAGEAKRGSQISPPPATGRSCVAAVAVGWGGMECCKLKIPQSRFSPSGKKKKKNFFFEKIIFFFWNEYDDDDPWFCSWEERRRRRRRRATWRRKRGGEIHCPD